MISFSVITCTYNAETVLQRTVDSVLAQTYPDVEHLIVDGASSDGTLAIVNKYVSASSEACCKHEVNVISEKDGGLYFAMNKGIDLAKKDYIVFLNAGDAFPSSDTLQKIADRVADSKDSPSILYGDTDIVDENGTFVRHRRLAPPSKLTWKSFKWGMLVCHQSFYVSSRIARLEHYNTNYRYSADVDWCIRVMKQAAKENLSLFNLHLVVTNYLDGGMSVQNHKKSLMERFSVMRTHYGLLTTVFMHGIFVFRAFFNK